MSGPNPPSATPGAQRAQSDRSLRNSESVVSSDDEGSLLENETGAKAWDRDSSECAICKSQLGKRRMNPRHHCRRCGRCICGKCSLSTIKFEGSKLQRACVLCAEQIHRTACLRRKAARNLSPLRLLSMKLCDFAGEVDHSVPNTLEEAVASCEASICTIKRSVRENDANKASVDASVQRACVRATQHTQMTADAEAALATCEASLSRAEAVASTQRAESMEACRKLRERLEHLGGADDASIALAHMPATVEEAMALCEASLGSVEIRCEQLLQLERDATGAMALLGSMSGSRPLAPPLEATGASFGASLVAEEDHEHDSCVNKCSVM